jgi:hypothetical protein
LLTWFFANLRPRTVGGATINSFAVLSFAAKA